MSLHGGWFIASMLLLMACGGCAAAQAANPTARARVPADGKITITEYGYRDWGPELVNYTVDPARFAPGGAELLDAAGAMLPFQIDGDTLSFVASVPKGGAASWTLRPKKTVHVAEEALTCDAKGGVLVVRNEFLAVRDARARDEGV